MRKIIEPFIIAPVATERAEEAILYYYDAQGQLLASLDHDEGKFCSGTFYGDVVDTKKRSFVYNIDYPTSPTGAHIQFVNAFTGEVYWIDNR